MAISQEILTDLRINPLFENALYEVFKPIKLLTYVDILVVVDTEIATEPGVEFGIGSVIELIRNAKVGCMRFRVDIASRSGGTPTVVSSPAAFAPKYTGFRFDMTNEGDAVIDRYEQIWCFGFKPDNFGGSDSNIDQPSALPATDSELAKLADWMKKRKGGIFATGDHDYLGASMCRKIPRIGTMRRWTNADGVPPISGVDRIDTLRPPSPAYEPGSPGSPAALSNAIHQSDLTPQPIQWIPWARIRTNFFVERVRPHPVLCHPRLGPIDIMPDHAHEGLCRDTGTIPLDGTYNFDGQGKQPEYPDAISGGAKPEPMVIAYGSTLGSPPYNFTKGLQPERPRFPMISVYDGHRAGVGRCATDSTWHHWMDVNIGEIKAAGGIDWDKISRYFINLAVWLNPPGYNTSCLYFSSFVSHFQHVGFQEYSSQLDDISLGRALREHLTRIYGPCWVTQTLFDIFDFLKRPLLEDPRLPKPDGCLTCPPFEIIEDAVLGGLVRASLEMAQQVKTAVAADRMPQQLRYETLDQLMLEGVEPALRGLVKIWREDMSNTERFLEQLAG
ncbi:hypothetical protein LC612_23880 [Nostoc sp. CHAB 5834]|nr:hypothetical protein [Nostoc sp. CHAB 5834]